MRRQRKFRVVVRGKLEAIGEMSLKLGRVREGRVEVRNGLTPSIQPLLLCEECARTLKASLNEMKLKSWT